MEVGKKGEGVRRKGGNVGGKREVGKGEREREREGRNIEKLKYKYK